MTGTGQDSERKWEGGSERKAFGLFGFLEVGGENIWSVG